MTKYFLLAKFSIKGEEAEKNIFMKSLFVWAPSIETNNTLKSYVFKYLTACQNKKWRFPAFVWVTGKHANGNLKPFKPRYKNCKTCIASARSFLPVQRTIKFSASGPISTNPTSLTSPFVLTMHKSSWILISSIQIPRKKELSSEFCFLASSCIQWKTDLLKPACWSTDFLYNCRVTPDGRISTLLSRNCW